MARGKTDNKVSSNSTAFCEVCSHSVYGMEKHVQSEEHKRNARKAIGEQRMSSGARFPGQSRMGNDVSPFPGRLNLRIKNQGGNG